MKFGIAVTGLALASAAFANAQEITFSGYVNPHQESWNWERRNGRGKLLNPYGCEAGDQDEWVCGFSQVLASQAGNKPSITEHLAMFSDRYVKNNGKIYAVKNSQGNGALADTQYRWHMKDGLYEVTIPDPNDWYKSMACTYLGGDGSCVVFKLLMEADNIGQIIAAPARFVSIQVIGVDQVTNRIYGYYPTASGWDRKRTVWGDAKDGSMRSYDWEVIGLSTNDRIRVCGRIQMLQLHLYSHLFIFSLFLYPCLDV